MRTKEWLKKMREKFGISQTKLSEESGVNKRTIENLEQGTRKGSEDTWTKIEEYFKNRENDNVIYSFDSDDLIQEIKEDILEFGKDCKCYLIYKMIDGKFIFTDYQFLDSEEEVENFELNEEEKKKLFDINKDLNKDEMFLETTLEYALSVFEKQNKI